MGLSEDESKNLENEINFIIKQNEVLAEQTIKNKISQFLSKYKHGNNIHEHGNSKTNEPHKCVLALSQRLDLRSSNKHVTLQTLFIYYRWKNIR